MQQKKQTFLFQRLNNFAIRYKVMGLNLLTMMLFFVLSTIIAIQLGSQRNLITTQGGLEENLRQLTKAANDFSQLRALYIDYTLAQNVAAKTAADHGLSSVEDRLTKISIIDTEKRNNLKQALGKFVRIHNKAANLAREGDKENVSVLVEEGRKQAEHIQSIFTEIIADAENKSKSLNASIYDSNKGMQIALWGLSAVIVLLGIMLSTILSKTITAPLAKAISIAEKIAANDYSSKIQVTSTDETGKLLESLDLMQTNLINRKETDIRIVSEVTEVVNSAVHGNVSKRISLDDKSGVFREIAENINQLLSRTEQVIKDVIGVFQGLEKGDLNIVIDHDYEGEYQKIVSGANATIKRLTQTIHDIISSANIVSHDISEIARANTDLSRRTEEQAASLAQTASSMEELAVTVRNNEQQANSAKDLASAAHDRAEMGRRSVTAVSSAMSEIDASSKKIGDIIGIIDEIAFQTNLLALNASVEAARAGEQGRGFAVVASEVRNLAQRSANAAGEIKNLIEDSLQKVKNGSSVAEDSDKALTEIVQVVSEVTDVMQAIAVATSQQSMSIQEVNTTITQLDGITQQNTAMVEEATAAAVAMKSEANQMINMMKFFNLSLQNNTDSNGNHSADKLKVPSAAQINAGKNNVLDDGTFEEF